MSHVEVKLSDYVSKVRPDPQWEIWFYEDNGTVTITSSSSWKCKEDAEYAALNNMLDGKI